MLPFRSRRQKLMINADFYRNYLFLSFSSSVLNRSSQYYSASNMLSVSFLRVASCCSWGIQSGLGSLIIKSPKFESLVFLRISLASHTSRIFRVVYYFFLVSNSEKIKDNISIISKYFFFSAPDILANLNDRSFSIYDSSLLALSFS